MGPGRGAAGRPEEGRGRATGSHRDLGRGPPRRPLARRHPHRRLPPRRAARPLGSDPDSALTYAADPEGWHTPLFAHIRKGNPRDGLVTVPGRPPLAAADLDGRRIIRRGIPYGPAFDFGRPDHEQEAPRGLVFVGYQADLVQQFEFLTKKWINDLDFPPSRNPRVGADPVLGPESPVTFETESTAGSRATTLGFGRYVRTEGALYAFTPSLPTLRALAQGKLDRSVEVHHGTVLRAGDVLDAGSVRLTLRTDGDLVLLDSAGSRLWAAGTEGAGNEAVFSADGELTVRDAAGAELWSSGTAGHPGARLLVRPAGDAVVLDGDRALWRAGGGHVG